MRSTGRGSASMMVAPARYPSATSTRARASFCFDQGMSTVALRAAVAFRTRVRKSAIGSVSIAPSPARLHESRDLAAAPEVAQAEPAHAEPPEEGPRPPAQRAAVVGAHLELRWPRRLYHETRLRHIPSVVRPGTASRARAASSCPRRPTAPSCK